MLSLFFELNLDNIDFSWSSLVTCLEVSEVIGHGGMIGVGPKMGSSVDEHSGGMISACREVMLGIKQVVSG